MIEELANLLESFDGTASQMRCFTHVLNLVVKSIIRQFDIPAAQSDKELDDATEELLKLASDIDIEEEKFDNNEDDESDNVEGWIDEREMMTEKELDELEASVVPVRLLLTKVRQP